MFHVNLRDESGHTVDLYGDDLDGLAQQASAYPEHGIALYDDGGYPDVVEYEEFLATFRAYVEAGW